MTAADNRRNVYEITFIKDARQQLERLPAKAKQELKVAIAKLVYSPYLGKALKGEHKGKYSLREWPYRVIYRVIKLKLVIEILELGHRQGIYK